MDNKIENKIVDLELRLDDIEIKLDKIENLLNVNIDTLKFKMDCVKENYNMADFYTYLFILFVPLLFSNIKVIFFLAPQASAAPQGGAQWNHVQLF